MKFMYYRVLNHLREAWNGCYGKIKYKNRSAAENSILKNHPEEFEMLPYRCKICRHWHIGHSFEQVKLRNRSYYYYEEQTV